MNPLEILNQAILNEAAWLEQMQGEYGEALNLAYAAYGRLQEAGNNLTQLVDARERIRGRSDAV